MIAKQPWIRQIGQHNLWIDIGYFMIDTGHICCTNSFRRKIGFNFFEFVNSTPGPFGRSIKNRFPLSIKHFAPYSWGRFGYIDRCGKHSGDSESPI